MSLSLVVIAALDSLNPTAIALQIYLLSTPKPIARSISFIVGAFLAYRTAGLLVMLGLRKLIMAVLASTDFASPKPHIYILQLLVESMLLMAGFSLEKSIQEDSVKTLEKLTLESVVAQVIVTIQGFQALKKQDLTLFSIFQALKPLL